MRWCRSTRGHLGVSLRDQNQCSFVLHENEVQQGSLATNEQFETVLEGHVRAFNWLGGVPQRSFYDSLATAIKKALSGHDRELNERFVVLRSHNLLDTVFCSVAAVCT